MTSLILNIVISAAVATMTTITAALVKLGLKCAGNLIATSAKAGGQACISLAAGTVKKIKQIKKPETLCLMYDPSVDALRELMHPKPRFRLPKLHTIQPTDEAPLLDRTKKKKEKDNKS